MRSHFPASTVTTWRRPFPLILSIALCTACAAEKKDFMASARELESRTLFAPAIRNYEEAIEKNPDDAEVKAEAHYRIGALANELGNSSFAADRFRAALEENAAHPEAKRALAAHHVNRGVAARTQGRIADARRELEAAVRVDPASVVAHLELGRTYEAENRLDHALIAYEAAARVDPQSIDVHLALGHTYLANRRYDRAVTALAAALAGNPERAEAYAWLGEAYFHQGRRDDAKQAFDQAMRRYLLVGRRDLARGVKDKADALFGVSAKNPK